MDKRYDLMGQRFHRLTVVGYHGKNKYNNNVWICKCDCGEEITVASHSLLCGNTKSCGCLQKEKATKTLMSFHKTHGLSRDSTGKKTRLFRIWCGIKTRCLNPNVVEYPRYGGRGISICSEWINNYKTFYDWAISHGYSDQLTIERIDTNGNYEPNNCKWSTSKEQANNRRNNTLVRYNGKTNTLSQWAELYGMSCATLCGRLKRGWTIEQALSIPVVSDDFSRKVKPDIRTETDRKKYSKLNVEVDG